MAAIQPLGSHWLSSTHTDPKGEKLSAGLLLLKFLKGIAYLVVGALWLFAAVTLVFAFWAFFWEENLGEALSYFLGVLICSVLAMCLLELVDPQGRFGE